jgi:thiol:disulfide interchange protein
MMADEAKRSESCQGPNKKCGGAKAVVKYLIGIVLLVVGALLLWYLRKEFLILVQGCIGPFLLLAGAITIAIAKE